MTPETEIANGFYTASTDLRRCRLCKADTQTHESHLRRHLPRPASALPSAW
jgi:hypothetical protein